MLAVADSVASHTCLAGVFFSFDQHGVIVGWCGGEEEVECFQVDEVNQAR